MQNIKPPVQGLELIDGVRSWRIWSLLGWQDIKGRYRGSALGPVWLVGNLAVVLVGISVLYGELLKQPLETYMPFLTVSLILQGLIWPLLLEACNAFATSPEIVRQVRMPLSVLVIRTIYRNLIVAGHNLILFLIVFVAFKRFDDIRILEAILGLFLVVGNLGWMTVVLAVAGARYRDVFQIMNSLLAFLAIFTPLYWVPEMIKNNTILLDINPLYHLIEVLRDPLLGTSATQLNYLVTGIGLVAGWGLAVFLFARTRKHIAFWV